jgi:hypothetical protein
MVLGGLTLAVSPDTIGCMPKRFYRLSKSPQKAPRSSRKAVILRYRHPSRVNGNKIRLRALVLLLGLSASEVARASGVSRSYVARLLSPRDHFSGSPAYFRTLEAKLPEVIAGRTSQYFTLPAVPVQRARDVLEIGLAA